MSAETVLSDLYQEVILDHNKNPRNFTAMENHSHHACGHNHLCGDRLDVYLRIENNVIVEVSFVGQGCAISKAASSIMTEEVKGKTVDEARLLFQSFHGRMTAVDLSGINDDLLKGKLSVFDGVRKFISRVKCATLPWHTLVAAIDHKQEEIVS